MSGTFQFEAPTALSFFASLVAQDDGMPLMEAAISIAQDEVPDLDTQGVLADIDRLADSLKRRIPSDAPGVQKLRWLNLFFFKELGFAGNTNDYYDPANSYIHRVLATRRGLPITLALVYIELATSIGLTARGISFPGHFLIKLRLQAGKQNGEVVIDPFTGRSLSREDLDELLVPYRTSRGLEGEFEIPLGLFLQPASSREVLTRMLRNLKELHRSAGDWLRLLAVLNRLIVLQPTAFEERKDRAMALIELGREAEAAQELSTYLENSPAGEGPITIDERLDKFRQAGQSPLR